MSKAEIFGFYDVRSATLLCAVLINLKPDATKFSFLQNSYLKIITGSQHRFFLWGWFK